VTSWAEAWVSVSWGAVGGCGARARAGVPVLGEAVAVRIRRLRLENAHRDLADGSLRGTPIHTVAARWGYPRVCDLTRAFRAAYGTSPREYRQQAPPEAQ
jgi:AraC-like DNA-binding protein